MKLLIDSDCLFAAYVAKDPHHKIATTLLKKHQQLGSKLYITNLVLQELATVFSHKIGQLESIELIQKVKLLNLLQITIDETLEKHGWQIFLKQTKKGTSYVDCANLAVCDYYKIDGILSFDEFYKDRLVTG